MRKVLVAFSFFVFTACSNYSIFSKLDYPDTEKISTYTGKKLIQSLEENINSTKFYETLSEKQKNRIIDSLDDYIQKRKNSTCQETLAMVTRASIVAIDIFINTDSLVYEIIYNMANPAFVYLTEPSASPSTVFYSFTITLKKAVEKDNSIVKPLGLCFYNLYKIAEYYNIAILSSKYGGYSGSDLQKYIVSAVVSAILTGTAQTIGISSSEISSVSEEFSTTEIKNLATEIAQVYIQIQQNEIQEDLYLNEIFSELEKKLGLSEKEIAQAYKDQLILKANILEKIALFAGFYNLAKESVEILKKWGNDEESM